MASEEKKVLIRLSLTSFKQEQTLVATVKCLVKLGQARKKDLTLNSLILNFNVFDSRG